MRQKRTDAEAAIIGFVAGSSGQFRITLKGFLAVRLMEFDYAGKHYSYHGRKLENALTRLLAKGGPQKPTTAELVVWGQAVHDWKQQELSTGYGENVGEIMVRKEKQ